MGCSKGISAFHNENRTSARAKENVKNITLYLAKACKSTQVKLCKQLHRLKHKKFKSEVSEIRANSCNMLVVTFTKVFEECCVSTASLDFICRSNDTKALKRFFFCKGNFSAAEGRRRRRPRS